MKTPLGFRLAGVACGLKRDATKLDLALVVAEAPCTAAGVYTTNRVFAAPVAWDRGFTPCDTIRGLVVNSGNANACTGTRGLEDAATMAREFGLACGCSDREVLVMSTGIIGHHLPMDLVVRGIREGAAKFGCDASHQEQVSRAIMTTDTFPKTAFRSVRIANRDVHLLGFAKGAGMIAPQMATMLGFVLTDFRLSKDAAQALLQRVADRSFNAISVDGHMSTNDTLLLLASAAAFDRTGDSVTPADNELFERALLDVCQDLAKAIVRDGEGATHTIEIQVESAASDTAARAIARAIANSPLVKTAIAGCDPNWGRIVSAAGYAPAPFDSEKARLRLNDTLLFEHGEPQRFDPVAVSTGLRQSSEVRIVLECHLGTGQATFWTCDLTAEYVRINADYHT